MPHRGEFKYNQEMSVNVSVRMTPVQIQSLTAMSHAMSLTVGDVVRAAVDDWLSDVPEPALFTHRVRAMFGPIQVSKPRNHASSCPVSDARPRTRLR